MVTKAGPTDTMLPMEDDPSHMANTAGQNVDNALPLDFWFPPTMAHDCTKYADQPSHQTDALQNSTRPFCASYGIAATENPHGDSEDRSSYVAKKEPDTAGNAPLDDTLNDCEDRGLTDILRP